MKDNLGIFGHPEDNTGEFNVEELRAALTDNSRGAQPSHTPRLTASRERRVKRITDQQRKRRRLRSSLIALGVLLLIMVGTFVLVRTWSNEQAAPPADFSGVGTIETVIRISSGDGASEIAGALLKAKVIASTEAFLLAAQNDAGIKAIQPGYYKVREGASAADTVTALLNPTNRVGVTELIPGNTLADTSVVATGKTLDGYVTQITKAACVPLNGVSDCFTTDQLWQVIKTADVTALGLVDWAIPRVNAIADPARRLEGMIAPGVYNIPPVNDPLAVLKSVIGASAVYWNTTEITTKAAGKDPYDLAIIASLIERESITADMPNVSRVIANRLALPMRLQLDSTVNYWKAESQVATSDADRNDASNPYNTYLHEGLPPTPIGAPGPNAITAALNPAPGAWMYFVKIDPKTGESCFSITLEEHNHCVDQARANGVFG